MIPSSNNQINAYDDYNQAAHLLMSLNKRKPADYSNQLIKRIKTEPTEQTVTNAQNQQNIQRTVLNLTNIKTENLEIPQAYVKIENQNPVLITPEERETSRRIFEAIELLFAPISYMVIDQDVKELVTSSPKMRAAYRSSPDMQKLYDEMCELNQKCDG